MPDVPVALGRFVLRHFPSLEHLDAFVATSREPTRWWTGDALSTAIGTPVRTAEEILEDLCSSNLLSVRIGASVVYQFDPGSLDVQLMAEQLMDALRRDRVAIHTLITSRAARALREFAGAFRIRGSQRG